MAVINNVLALLIGFIIGALLQSYLIYYLNYRNSGMTFSEMLLQIIKELWERM